MDDTLIIPQSEPYFIPGGPTGCLLLHGFTSTPEEMRWLGDDLAARGHTVLGQRLAGHATTPQDLARTRWPDWLASVEDGLALLQGVAQRTILIGQSMGGMLALAAAARYPVAGVVAISTPYATFSRKFVNTVRLLRLFGITIHKKGRTIDQTNPLAHRREPSYPAYPSFPIRIYLEVARLQQEMGATLHAIRVPVLLLHSDQDNPNSMEQIYAELETPTKTKLLLPGFDHSIVRDPQRQTAFEAIAAFIDKLP